MRKLKTGDLILTNEYTLSGILSHLTDQTSRWSNIGIVIVNEENESVNVAILTEDEIELVELHNILRSPTLQAAAHRSFLNAGKYAADLIKFVDYVRGSVKGKNINTEIVLDALIPGRSKLTVTTLGTTVDSRGRDLTSDPKTKKGFYNGADFIGSVLSYTGYLKYRHNFRVSDFQEGGIIDDIYDGEVAVPPVVVSPNNLVNIMTIATLDIRDLIGAYYSAKPVMTNNDQIITAADNKFEVKGERKMSNEIYGLDQYGDTASTVIPLKSRRDKGLLQKAQAIESEAIDKKVRKKAEQLAQYERPKPKFK